VIDPDKLAYAAHLRDTSTTIARTGVPPDGCTDA
jgi:hypothetical protein